MLKIKLDSLEGLDDATKALYTEKDGKFLLQLEGYQDPDALLRAKQHEKDARLAAEAATAVLRTELDTLRADFDKARDDKHRKTGNIAELDASWQTKLDAANTKHADEIAKLNGQMSKLLIEGPAAAIAAKLSDTPELLEPLIRARLTVEQGANGPETRVRDASGALSAKTVDELTEEFKSNVKYATVIRGSQASGGGSNGGGNGGSAPKPFKDMTGVERTALFKSNPAGYQREMDAMQAQAAANR